MWEPFFHAGSLKEVDNICTADMTSITSINAAFRRFLGGTETNYVADSSTARPRTSTHVMGSLRKNLTQIRLLGQLTSRSARAEALNRLGIPGESVNRAKDRTGVDWAKDADSALTKVPAKHLERIIQDAHAVPNNATDVDLVRAKMVIHSAKLFSDMKWEPGFLTTYRALSNYIARSNYYYESAAEILLKMVPKERINRVASATCLFCRELPADGDLGFNIGWVIVSFAGIPDDQLENVPIAAGVVLNRFLAFDRYDDDVRLIIDALALVSKNKSPEKMESVARDIDKLCVKGMMGSDFVATLIKELAAMPDDERARLVQLWEPLREVCEDPDRDTDLDPVQMLEALIETPAEGREAHRDRLLAHIDNQDDEEDLENVMYARRITRTNTSIAALRQALPDPLDTEKSLDAIEEYIQTHCGDLKQLSRGGGTEFDNALCTLEGEVREGDFSKSLRQDPEMGSLAALVWHAIDVHQDPKQDAEGMARLKEEMRHFFVMAIALCIEDDGHRVCNVGTSQRLMTTLQGHYECVHIDDVDEPGRLLGTLAQEFAQQYEEAEPPADALSRFFSEAMTTARSYYEPDSPDVQRFESDLRAYLKYEFPAWEPGDQGSR